jgi:hypothetical protein
LLDGCKESVHIDVNYPALHLFHRPVRVGN